MKTSRKSRELILRCGISVTVGKKEQAYFFAIGKERRPLKARPFSRDSPSLGRMVNIG